MSGIVSPALETMGFELVLVRLTGGTTRPNVQVMAERTDSCAMSIDDCAMISRALDRVLDAADLFAGHWQLEVSSPGIDRPLVREKDWVRAVGRLANVEVAQAVAGRRRFSGLIVGVAEQIARLRLEDETEVSLPLTAIRRARLALPPDLLAGAAAAARSK